jgi:succinate-acetate transporter protein
VLLGVGNAGAHPDPVKVGGWVGLATAAVAWHGSFAAIVNSTFGRKPLPVLSLRR